MTVAEARKRYPYVPREILKWALENIENPRDLERGLTRLDQARRIQMQYGV